MAKYHCPRCDNVEFRGPNKDGLLECEYCHAQVKPEKASSKRHALDDVFEIMKKLYKQQKDMPFYEELKKKYEK